MPATDTHPPALTVRQARALGRAVIGFIVLAAIGIALIVAI